MKRSREVDLGVVDICSVGDLRLTGDCACGGKMVQVKNWRGRLLPEWKCERSHWWDRRRKHAYLVVTAELVDRAQQRPPL